MSKININIVDLHALILSLSKSEKRHFKIYASRHTDASRNRYVALFDLLEEQEKYDEKDLENNRHKLGKALPQLKNYLYNLILKALVVFHSGSSPDAVVKNILLQVVVLFEKRHYSQCGKLLQKAERVAAKYELYRIWLEIIVWQKKIMLTTQQVSRQETIRISRHEKKAVEIINNNHVLWESYADMMILALQIGSPHNAGERSRAEKLISGIHTLSYKNALSSEAKTMYYLTKEGAAYLKQDWNGMYRWLKQHLGFMNTADKQHPQEKFRIYAGALYGITEVCIKLRKYQEAFAYIRMLRSKSAYTHYRILFRSYSLELTLYTDMVEPQKAIPLILEIEKGLKRFGHELRKPDIMSLYHQLFYIYFLMRDYARALHWLNKILDDKEISVREDIHCIARILNLILHFDLGNMELLPYTIRSSERFLSKRNHLHDMEKLMIRYFRKLFKTVNRETQTELFTKLEKELLASVSESQFQTAHEYFDFTSWIESKIENRLFAEVVREKAENGENKQA